MTKAFSLHAVWQRLSCERLNDTLFLTAISIAPALFYVSSLGFYLDDYYFLGLMSTDKHQSLTSLYDTIVSEDPKAQLRPLVYVGIAGLYLLFGTNPLPYQIVLVVEIAVCTVLLYVVLSHLRLPRFLALGVPLLFAAAPHYSSDRFWPIAYSLTLSLILYLVSLYTGLRALETRGVRVAAWLGLSAASMLMSAFMYEVPLPLFVLNGVLFWYRSRRLHASRQFLPLAYGSVLVLAIVVKLVQAIKVGGETSYHLGYESGFLHHVAYLVSGGIKVNFGTYGVGLPYVVWWIFANRFSWLVLAASLLVGVATFLYLRRAVDGRALSAVAADERRLPDWRAICAAGVVLLVAAYASFLITGSIYFTSAGIDNRVNIVAALGIAVLTVGLLLGAAHFLPARRRATALAAGVAVLSAVGILVTNTLATFWASAYDRQKQVLGRLHSALPSEKSDSTVVVDGVCPEVGPGVVFAAHYDLAGALKTAYRDRTLDGLFTTPTVRVGRDGVTISTRLFEQIEPHFYPYRRRLILYDWRRGTSHRLTGPAQARRYLAATPRLSCPPLRSFVWGIHTSRWVPFA
jgi:hypothetical protein